MILTSSHSLGHGTAIASVIMAGKNNQTVQGVSPKVKLFDVKVQKVNHFLAIADFYIQLKNASGVKMFHVEPNYTEYVRPDACTIWRKTAWFIEVQCSHYTQKTMSEKISRYQTYFNSGEWKSLQFQKENSPFPFVWIIGEHHYKIKTDGIRVFQSKSVEDFLMRYVEKKQKELA
ncbi:replication-relaxation family protein [Bacillus nakamurai]|nr:replication-relaxation family protein [Bacillus nakamurai]MED1227138.1 replication-relaxation family protein [Bacillus nakamurai]